MSIASEITRIQNAKASIKTSIENKGVTVGDGTLDTYASKIDAIETGITPTGTIDITENGTYDVTDKASANVNVEGLKGTKIEITKNGTYTPEEPYNGFTEVNVNMEPDLSEYFGGKLKAGDSSYYYSKLFENIKKIPLLEIEGTSCQYMFRLCKLLTSIPLLDTSKVTDMSSMFYSCSGLITIPQLDTSKVTTMSSMFSNCKSLTSIPQLDTSKVTTVYGMFGYCDALISLPLLNFSNVIDIRYFFDSTSSGTLTILGGFQNLGQAYLTTQSANYNNYKLDLTSKYNLTHDSLMNVGNNLYDIASKGCKTQQVIIGSNNIGKLTPEELLVFTNKGWSVS